MKKICPIDGLDLSDLPRFGDYDRFECPNHGIFRVTGSSEAVGFWEAPRDQQARALEDAIAAAPKGQEPVVIFYA